MGSWTRQHTCMTVMTCCMAASPSVCSGRVSTCTHHQHTDAISKVQAHTRHITGVWLCLVWHATVHV